MTIEQITAKAEKMNLSSQLMELLAAAFEAGQVFGVSSAVLDLADDGQVAAVEFLTANYPVTI